MLNFIHCIKLFLSLLMYISVSHSRPSTDQPYENSEAILKIIAMKTKQSTPLMKQL